MVWFCVVVSVPLLLIFVRVLKQTRPDRRPSRAGWMAFYFTVPLAVYDWLYCGIYLGFGLRFLSQYWYLTVFYVIPWPVLLAVATLLNRRIASSTQPAPFVRNR